MQIHDLWIAGDDATLRVDIPGGPLLIEKLGELVIRARLSSGDGELFRFTWQPHPLDEDEPLPPRRYARVIVEEIPGA
jgi:hypothetical protein